MNGLLTIETIDAWAMLYRPGYWSINARLGPMYDRCRTLTIVERALIYLLALLLRLDPFPCCRKVRATLVLAVEHFTLGFGRNRLRGG